MNTPLIIITIGILVCLSLGIKSILKRFNIPALPGWIILGFLCRFIGDQFGFFTEPNLQIFEFLAKIGILTLLFKIGLESKIGKLLKQLKKASFIWTGNVLISGLFGYLLMFYLLEASFLTSLSIAIALTATSVGVSVSIWQNAGALKTNRGQLLLDVAEMDDISSIILMGFLFALLPVLSGNSQVDLLPVLSQVSLSFLLKMAGYSLLCVVFARYLEKPISDFVRNLEPKPDPMLTIVGFGFIIASISALAGFSLALGAFFAGLSFSRDPEAVKMEASFKSIYELFTPFFFIGIGIHITMNNLINSGNLSLFILLAAVLGKIIGTALPALAKLDKKSSVVLGLSMVPRAEITMIVAAKARDISENLVSPELFSAIAVVVIFTCLLAPLILHYLINKWPETAKYE